MSRKFSAGWKAIIALCLTLLLFALAGCTGKKHDGAGGHGSSKNYDGRRLNIYVSFNEDTAQQLIAQFQKDTGANVSFIRMPTGEAMSRLIAEKDAPKVDVWLGGTADAHAKLKSDGIIVPYAAENGRLVPADYRDSDNYWHGLYLETLAIGYNKDRFNRQFAPKGITPPASLDDLLNPAFKGEIVMPDPRTSGTGLTFLASIIQSMGNKKGWEYLDKFKPQVANFTPSGFTPGQKCASGECLITVNFLSDQLVAGNKGKIIASTIYKNAGWSVVPVSQVKNQDSDRKLAEAFIEFCLTKEAGEIISRTTNAVACNIDVPVPAGQKMIGSLPLYRAFDIVRAGAAKKSLCDKFFAEKSK